MISAAGTVPERRVEGEDRAGSFCGPSAGALGSNLLPTAALAPGQVGLLELAPVMCPFVAGFDPLLAMTVRNSSSDGETWRGLCFHFRWGRSLLALPGALLCMGEDWGMRTMLVCIVLVLAWGCTVGVLLEKCSHWASRLAVAVKAEL
ncbi:hypothetical protein B0H10DRAFT_1960422 [Mycena sp. CBHHK59/15]|nr:hypothetical protein B0H10DRAFT_1960422 [Mycena sp. CBHHK59/15]